MAEDEEAIEYARKLIISKVLYILACMEILLYHRW